MPEVKPRSYPDAYGYLTAIVQLYLDGLIEVDRLRAAMEYLDECVKVGRSDD